MAAAASGAGAAPVGPRWLLEPAEFPELLTQRASAAIVTAKPEEYREVCIAASARCAKEGTPFRHHITLGRVREGERCTLRSVQEAGSPVEQVPFLATDLVLYASVPGGGRQRYEPRLTVELGA